MSGRPALVNLRLWEDAERFVVAHPGDRALIEIIGNSAEIRLDLDTASGGLISRRLTGPPSSNPAKAATGTSEVDPRPMAAQPGPSAGRGP